MSDFGHQTPGLTWGCLFLWSMAFFLSLGYPRLSLGSCAEDQVQIEGLVTYDGSIPSPIPIAEAATERNLIEVDSLTKGLKDAVVWLEGLDKPLSSDVQTLDEVVVMDQQNFFFLPHVLAINSGQKVEFRNSDVANHGVNATSIEPRNQFNVVTPPGGHYVHAFVRSTHPVAIGCPVHPAMAAWVFVFDHPYHAVADEKGHFKLPVISAGQYTLKIQHPDGRLRKSEPLSLAAGKPVRLRVEFHEADRKTAPAKPD